jgi:predicted PhzF superfamily epimerase YddE/YHI9
VLDGAAIPPAGRQAVAGGLGFSETVFVDDAATGALRIFTPTVELPLAGHPLVGTAWLLARTGTPAPTLRPPAGDVPTWTTGDLTWIRARSEWATLYDVAQLESAADVDAMHVPGGDAMVAVWAMGGRGGRARARAGLPQRHRDREDEATGAAAIQLGALTGRDIVIRQGAGSELHARSAPDGTVAVGGGWRWSASARSALRPPPHARDGVSRSSGPGGGALRYGA